MKRSRTNIAASAVRPIPMRKVRGVVRQIVERFSPRRVVLFGSRAAGRADEGSDVDLLVITDRNLGPDASLRIRRAIRYDFPLDLVVCQAKRLDGRLEAGDFFLQDAVESGKVLYERSHT